MRCAAAQTQFIPVSAARAPLEPDLHLRHPRPTPPVSARAPRRRAPAAAAASPPRFHRRPPSTDTGGRPSAGPLPEQSPGAELTAASAFLDDGGAHLRSAEQLGTLQRLRLDGRVADSVEVLDEFLAGFVNEGNTAAPLYSSMQLLSRAPPRPPTETNSNEMLPTSGVECPGLCCSHP